MTALASKQFHFAAAGAHRCNKTVGHLTNDRRGRVSRMARDERQITMVIGGAQTPLSAAKPRSVDGGHPAIC